MTVNDLYKDINTDVVYRVIALNILLNRIAVIDIFSTKDCPHWERLDEFKNRLDNNVIQLIPECFPRVIDESVLNDVEKEHRNKLMGCISFGIDNHRSELLERESRNAVYKALAEKFDFSIRTVERIFGRYWKRGMTRAALVPDYKLEKSLKELLNRSLVGKQINKKNGRKRIHGNTTGIIITDAVKDQMDDIIKNFYFDMKKPAFSNAYEELLKTYYIDHFYIDEFGEPQYYDEHVPSLSQFYYHYRNKYLIDTKIKYRQGSALAEQICRPLLSNSYKDVTGPGQVYQLDATVIDVVIVHSGTRQPIGKPVVIALIDVYSRLVVGLYVTIEKECYESLGLAILNVVTDKVEFCEKQGIPMTAKKYPNSGLPQRILTDNGPARNILFDYLIKEYSVDIEHTPPYRGDLKGIIENFWKTLGLEARTKLNGGGEWPITRMTKDPSKLADLDINELTKILTLLTIKHNTSTIQGLKQNKDMLNAQVRPIPCEMWAFGFKSHKGYINNVGNIEQLKLALMREGEKAATITQKGIQIDKRYYICEPFIKEKWYLTRKEKKVNYRYDKKCLNFIYIPTRTGSIPCILAENSEQFLNLAEFEYNQIKDNKAIENSSLIKSKIANSINIGLMIDEVMAEGASKTKNAREDNSISSINKNEARIDERDRIRKAEFLTTGLNPEFDMLYREYKSDLYDSECGYIDDESCSDDFLSDSIRKLNKNCKEEAI